MDLHGDIRTPRVAVSCRGTIVVVSHVSDRQGLSNRTGQEGETPGLRPDPDSSGAERHPGPLAR